MSRYLNARVVFDGQSLNAAPLANPYPRQLMTTLRSGVPWTNVPISGTSWTTLAKSASQRSYLFGTKAAVNIFIMCGGTSDITDGDTAATIYADMESYADGARTAGFDYVIGTTITPSTSFTGPQETVRVAANVLIMADAGAAFEAQVDFAADTRLDDPTDATYYTDGLHWTTAGAGVAAELMAPALDVALRLVT